VTVTRAAETGACGKSRPVATAASIIDTPKVLKPRPTPGAGLFFAAQKRRNEFRPSPAAISLSLFRSSPSGCGDTWGRGVGAQMLGALDAEHVQLAVYVSENEIGSHGARLFDHLIGAGEQRQRHIEAERPRCLAANRKTLSCACGAFPHDALLPPSCLAAEGRS
jgi:hypothetical protein